MTEQNPSDFPGQIRDSLDPRLRGDDDWHRYQFNQQAVARSG